MPDPIRPIVGNPAAWGFPSGTIPVKPYTLTPGATDTMSVRVREKIDIHGVGTDVVELHGTFTVRRDHPAPPDPAAELKWGNAIVRTEFRSLELSGQSSVFGTVRVHLDPSQVSSGVVGPADANSLAAKCAANLKPVIELPELGMTLSTGGQAVQLASKVIQIPPVGDVARSESSVGLQDPNGNVVGELVSSDIEVGNVLATIPLGATSPQGAPPPLPASTPAALQRAAAGAAPGFFTRTPG